MGDAAHAESLDHVVYRRPFAVEPSFESWDTPDNYQRSYVGPGKLPEKMKVWLVQKTGKTFGSVVASGGGFTDSSPDAEILALGFNTAKSYGSVGIGRQGNFLQWGYAAPPSQMTEAGRRLFLNCIHYIRRFEGKAPLVHISSSPRRSALSMAHYLHQASDPRRSFLTYFPRELYEKYHSDPNGLTEYYRRNLEWVFCLDQPLVLDLPGNTKNLEQLLSRLPRTTVFKVDEELKGLGIDSNRKVEGLQRLVELLDDAQRAALAKQLLSRYTEQSFETPQQWRQWFEANRERIFFSDVGGYKFLVMPVGYLAVETAKK